ncbi:MAG TPA: DUF1592 domain-containing protein [Candidatus Acidoferrum sp.]|nr:DUF1592 domain-containing protein [Candidatus Acidoferrum sp.]
MLVRIGILIFVTLTLVGCRQPIRMSRASTAQSEVAAKSFQHDLRPVVSEYCNNCHNSEKHKGDVVLDKFTDDATVMADRATWEKVLKNVRSRAMPPEGKPQPTEEQRALLENWLETKLFAIDCENPDPGRVTIRRLNRSEYNHTIRDLVGVDFQPADSFPADDVGYGFDNIGDVLSMPPILLEKYLAAAEKILDAAIIDPNAKPQAARHAAVSLPGTAEGGAYTSKIRALASAGEVFVDYFAPIDGEYGIRARVFQQQVGEGPARMAFRVGGKETRVFDVRVGEQRPETYETTVQMRAGTNRFAVAFVNPLTITNEPDPKAKRRDQRVTVRTRRLMVDYLEIVPPAGAHQTLPESHQRIFICRHSKDHDESCAREVIGQFARRAFRRPVTGDELDRLLKVYGVGKTEGESFERSVQLALQAVLVSPHFLFRGEIVPDPNNPKSVHPVNDFALASRLSYFLWSSTPDDELLHLASRGDLSKPGVIEAQVKRMLKNPKSTAFVENFTGQWLQIRNLWKVTPDTNIFASFTDTLRGDMERETELFFETVMREDRSLLDFIDGNYTFVNERLARHYGMEGVRGEAFQRVAFKDKSRGGVLTHGSVMTITSNPTRTSPVKRGKWVLDNLLGTPPPPPPPDVPDLKDQKELTGTLRQKMEMHRVNPNCSSCHERMDPIGFGLENFNAVGVWREKDEELPIDSSGKLPGGEKFNGPSELRNILRQQKDLFARCLTEKMLTYALGRGLEYYDKCALDKITATLAKKDYKFSVLITEIVKSAPFQMRRGDGEADHLAAAAGN